MNSLGNSNVSSSILKKKQSRDFSWASNQVSSVASDKCTRWSKIEDIELFKTFKGLWMEFNIDPYDANIYEAMIRTTVSILYKISTWSIWIIKKQILQNIVIERKLFLNKLKKISNWRGTYVELKDRIVKIITTNKLTARDMRVLKRMLRQEDRGEITMNDVLDAMPGKTLDQINKFKKRYIIN